MKTALRAGIPPFYVMDVWLAAAERQRTHGDLVNLSAGQPSVGAPEPVRAAAIEALTANQLGYTVALGIPELRAAIAQSYAQRHGLAVDVDDVVLTTGGFVMNPEMLAQYVPQLGDRVMALGSTYDDGLGIRMGQSVGAATKYMDQAFMTAPVYPPAKLLTGLIVNRNGDRFVAEDSYHARTSAFTLEQPDSAAYLIVDSQHVEMPAMPLVPLIDGWEDVADMETALGIPAGRLQASLDRYNANAARGVDPDFHKAEKYLEPQVTGPWAAFDLSLGKAFYSGFTLGGLDISADGEVRRDDGSVVAGLYAAGASASTLAQDAKGYSSGTQLGAGSFFGRRAGRAAAAAATG